MYRVFISYASPLPLAEDIAKAFEPHGIDVFWDKANLRAGDALSRRLCDELSQCDEVCLLWSRAANDSQWVRFECAVAFAYGKQVVPLVDDSDTPLPEQYAHLVKHELNRWYSYVQDVADRASQKRGLQNTSITLGPNNGPCLIISHCEDRKWTKDGFPQAPGYLLRGYLSAGRPSDAVKLEKLRAKQNSYGEARRRIDPFANMVWLLDSPASNKLVGELVDSYRQWTSGGHLRWTDQSP